MLLSLQNGIDNEVRIARVTGHTSGIGAVLLVNWPKRRETVHTIHSR
jgi:hypothetical protein